MNEADFATALWRKSSRSNGQTACVEVASLSTATAIRDSKDPDGAALVFSAEQWRAFVAGVKSGEFRLE